jgi:small-conductance mechanosensitive channel
MTGESLRVSQWMGPFGFIVSGFLIGIIVEKIILAKLKKITAQTRWGGAEIVITALRGMTVIWGGASGIYLALLAISMSDNFLRFLQKLLLAIAVFSATLVLSRISMGFINLYAERVQGVLPSTSILTNLTRVLIFLLGILIMLQSVGVSITPILTGLGVGGIAVALALQDTLSNLFSGLHIVASQQVKIGDYVKLAEGGEGYVTDITWRNTTIRMLSNSMIVVPNSKLASAIITNYHLPEKELAVLVEVGVSYESSLSEVERITTQVAREVMKEVPGGVREFEPFIRYHTFGDFSIGFTVILRGKEFADQYLIKHEFVKRLHERYKKEGIKIPSSTERWIRLQEPEERSVPQPSLS